MRLRPAVFCFCLCYLGAEPISSVPVGTSAVQLWEKGQQAILKGDADGAIAAYRESLRLDPSLTRNYLSMAAAYLEKGEDGTAAASMGDYIHHQPDHLVIRAHYAELLLRLDRRGEAREQFERFVADVQARPDLADEHLIHCHSRLMEIAESQEDEYGEHLNRGIGLYLLAKQRSALPDPDGELSTESLLCKAAGELTLAREVRPDEARPCWYLYAVWTRLGQRQPATRWLRAAAVGAPFTYLTPCEREALQLAYYRCNDESRRK